MSQIGFPNGGIMPDNDADFTYSNIILTEQQIKDAAAEVKEQSYDATVFNYVVNDTIQTTVEGLITAATMVGQYYIQQVTYQGENGYGSANNPVQPSWSQSVKELFTKSLGTDPDPEQLYSTYEYSSRSLDGVNNTFFNLGLGSKAFTWDANGNLNISDTYLFTGWDDVGAAPTFNQLNSPFGVLTYLTKLAIAVVIGTPLVPLSDLKGNSLISKLLFHLGNPTDDPTIPFNLLRFAQINGQNVTNIGLIEPMAFKTQFTPQELLDYNPELFWEAVKKGLIPFSALLLMPDFICNSVEVGSAPNAFLPNYGQVSGTLGSPDTWSFGGGGNYPRPFTSFAQRLVEASFSLGPFAMLDFKNTATNTQSRISGRICILSTVCDGAPSEIGFIRQDWYAADINNSIYSANGALEKWKWWEQCVKTKYTLPYGHLPGYPDVTVQIATASYVDGDNSKFSPNIGTPEDFTLLLGVVIAAAVIGGI
jgi:hypothetical protein